MSNLPAYFNPKHFAVGQRVRYGEFDASIVRHYAEGMWEIRVPGGIVCVSGAHLKLRDGSWQLVNQRRSGVLPEHDDTEFSGAVMEPCRLTIPAREALLAAGAVITHVPAPTVRELAGWEPAPGDYWRIALGQRCPADIAVRQAAGSPALLLRRNDEPEWPDEMPEVPHWHQLDLTPCPTCGASLVWYEAGYVPGYRVCAGDEHHHWLWRRDDAGPRNEARGL